LRNVWWPLYGNFDHLHPEYEVLDWRGRSYFADFAWLPGALKVVYEIKGFGPHVRDMDRKGYCDELNRETFLQTLGMRVVSFAYDDVAQRPELCRNLLSMLHGRYRFGSGAGDSSSRAEKEILLLAYRLARPIRPKGVHDELPQPSDGRSAFEDVMRERIAASTPVRIRRQGTPIRTGKTRFGRVGVVRRKRGEGSARTGLTSESRMSVS
jgi:hypothetical protein